MKIKDIKNKKGFTIIELLISMTLLGIILGILVSFIGNSGRLSKQAMAQYEAQTNAKILTSYVAMIIRQNDVSGDIKVQALDGIDYLTIKVNSREPDPATPYYWHIYFDDALVGDKGVYEFYNTNNELEDSDVVDLTLNSFQIVDNIDNFIIEPINKDVPGTTTGEKYLAGIKLTVIFNIGATDKKTLTEVLTLRTEYK